VNELILLSVAIGNSEQVRQTEISDQLLLAAAS